MKSLLQLWCRIRNHRWSRSKKTPGVKTCARCGLMRSINKRVKA